ncbi:MAG: SLC13 family permease [Alphaproteobacteria bacterium]
MLTTPQILAVAIFAAALAGFVWERVRYDVVALAALAACVLAGLVKADEAFLGFGNPAVVTVAAVLVLSHALARSGVVGLLGGYVARVADTPLKLIVLLCGLGAALSGFMNNVGALALLMPVAIATARRHGHSPSLVLMPLSFATMLGGTMTIIGTPPNLLVAGFRERYGEPNFGFFDFTPIGLAVTLAGLAFMALAARWLLPGDRQGTRSAIEQFDVGHYVTEVEIPENSPLAGKTVREVEAAHEDRLTVISLLHEGLRVHQRRGTSRLAAGDELIVQADAELLQELVQEKAIEVISADPADKEKPTLADRAQIETAEVVVPPNAWIQGQTARGLRLRARYGVNLLAMSRKGRALPRRLRDTPFFAGDVLLLEGESEALADAIRLMSLLPLADRRIALEPSRIFLPIAIFVGAIALTATGIAAASISFTLAVLGVLAFRIVPLRDLYTAVDWPVVVLLGAMIPVGGVLESTGVAALAAESIAALALGPWAMLAVVMVATLAVTPALNNATTVIVMAPIAIGIAQALQVHPDPFLMAVAIAASCDFLTPFGHQNNTLILAPGGYRFSDYWRLGLPLDLIVLAVALALLPVVFPFH